MAYHNIRQGKYDEKLNNVIESVLNQVLGRQASETFYAHLESTHSIQRQNVALKLDSFSSALREYFGAGAGVIEQVIHKNLEFAELDTEASLPDKAKILKLV